MLIPGASEKDSSVTKAAIGAGTITVKNQPALDVAKLNRDTQNSLNKLGEIFDKKKIEERQELAKLIAKDAFNQLHYWNPKTKEDKAAKAIAHGIVGEIAARVAGNAPGSGFKATMTNEVLTEFIATVAKDNPDVVQWLSAIVSTTINKVTGKDVSVGATTAQFSAIRPTDIYVIPNDNDGATMKKRYYYSLISLCIIQFLALLILINKDSWFMNADIGSIAGIRSDYSIQLTNEGELIDNHQIAPNKIISTNISKYILVKLQDLGTPYNHNVLIMEEGNQTPPVYIIYDEMLDGYVFINKNIDFIGYWVGGYQILSDKDDFINKRYKSVLESQSWVKVDR